MVRPITRRAASPTRQVCAPEPQRRSPAGPRLDLAQFAVSIVREVPARSLRPETTDRAGIVFQLAAKSRSCGKQRVYQ